MYIFIDYFDDQRFTLYMNTKHIKKHIKNVLSVSRLTISHIPYHGIVRKFEMQTPSTNPVVPSASKRRVRRSASIDRATMCAFHRIFLYTYCSILS